jgi:hypothetical protein
MKKPPFSAVDMFVSDYFVAWLLSLNKRPSLLKRHDAKRLREEWHYRIFQVKAVKVYNVPQEKVFCKAHQEGRMSQTA